jgi:hypothetical protein
VVGVNETMAKRTWPDSDAVGQLLKRGADTWELIGVVSDTRSAFPLAPTLPAVYRPATPDGYASPSSNGVTLVIRAFPNIDGSARLMSEVRSIAPEPTVVEVKPVTREVDQALFLARVWHNQAHRETNR